MRHKNKVLRIRCSDDVWRAFRRYSADYHNYEEALRSLLIRAGVIEDVRVF